MKKMTLLIILALSFNFLACATNKGREILPDFSEQSVPVLNQILKDMWDKIDEATGEKTVYNDIDYTNQTIINSLAVFNVTDYGAKGNGTNDDTGAIRNAVAALESNGGGILYFPAGTYLWTGTVYLDSDDTDLTYYIMGDGRGSILKPVSGSDFFMLKLNENSSGTKVLTFPSHPRLVVSGLFINGASSTGNASFLWYNEASFIIKNITVNQLEYGVTGTGYTDLVRLEYIYSYSTITGQWLYKQGDNGDGFYANQLFCGDSNAVYLSQCNNGTIQNCINGRYVADKCHNVTFRNMHCENTDNGYAITIVGSNAVIENSYFNNFLTYEPIYLDNDASYNCKMDVIVRNNVFSTLQTAATDTTNDSIYINDFIGYSSLRLQNNKGIIWASGRGIWENIGITAEAADATLNTLLSTNKRFLTGDILLHYKAGAWVIDGFTNDGRLINRTESQSQYYSAPGTMYPTESATYPSNLAADTYYYTAAYYAGTQSTEGNTEESVTTASDNSSVSLIFSGYPHVVLRVWRGTSTGVYDRYVDIPMVEGAVELYDTGATLGGFTWIAVGVPAVPASNTTSNTLKIDTNSTSALWLERDGVNDDTMVVDTTNQKIEIANPAVTALAGVTPPLMIGGSGLGVTDVDANTKSVFLGNSTSGQTWILSHRGSGADYPNSLAPWYYDGASWNATPPFYIDVSNTTHFKGGIDSVAGVNFADATALEIPNAAAPTVDATGELAFDTDVITQGQALIYGTSALNYIVATTDTPGDNEIPKYDSASGTISWEADASGAGGSGSMTTIKESTVQVGDADIVSLDFGEGFDVVENPDTEANIDLDTTELNSINWSDGTLASINWYMLNSATDPVFTFSDALIKVHDANITVDSGRNLTFGTVQWTSSDEIDGTKIKDADYGDVVIDVSGDWQVENASHTHTAANISDQNAGTDITADLEEETHAAEHAVGAADTVFPADPNADRYLMWDDDPGALSWQTVSAAGVNFGATPEIPFMNAGATDFNYDSTFYYTSGILAVGSILTGGIDIQVTGINARLSMTNNQDPATHIINIYPSTSMTSDMDLYLPVDEPASTSLVTIDTAGAMGYSGTVSASLVNFGSSVEVSAKSFYGDPFNDYMTYIFASQVLSTMSSPVCLIGWLTPSDNGTEQDLTSSDSDFTYTDACNFTTSDQVRKGMVWTLDFDGSNDYLNRADDADFSFGDASNDSAFTVFGYVEVVADTNYKPIICKYDTGGNGEWFFDLTDSEQPRFGFYDVNVAKYAFAYGNASLSAGYHFIVGTYDGTGGATAGNGITIYVDGVSVAITVGNDAAYVAMENTTTIETIGAYAAGNVPFPGDMGIVGVTGGEMSASQVWQLWMAVRGYYNL